MTDKMREQLAAIQSAFRAAEFIDKYRHTIAQNAEDSKRLKALEQAMGDMCLVTKEDGNNYCRILTLLGMEEEGDAVAEVERLLAARHARQVPNYNELLGDTTEEEWVVIFAHRPDLANRLARLLAAAPSAPSEEVE